MSHFSRIQTQLTDPTYLLQALRELGFTVEEGALKVDGFLGRQAEVQILLKLENSYGIGLRFVDGAYEIVADWAGVRGLNQKQFVQQLTQRYAYRASLAKLEAQGFTLVEETHQGDGQIHLVMRRVRND